LLCANRGMLATPVGEIKAGEILDEDSENEKFEGK
jgi:hypothetical protein